MNITNICLRDLPGTENIVYTELEDLQRSVIPYYCEKHKVWYAISNLVSH